MRFLDWAWPGHPTRWRDLPRRLRPRLVEIARLTSASVVAFVLVYGLTGQRQDLTGALTAMLVVQASTYSTIKMGIVRVGAVLTGVLVAVLLTNWFGLSWWSLGAAVAMSLTIARVLRLGDQMLEAPISAMLILAVHGSGVAVQTRVVSTLIGAAVGMTFGLLLAPAVPARKAAIEVRRAADEVGGLLRASAQSMRDRQVVRSDVEGWLDGTRQIGGQVAVASARVSEVKDSRRLNVWALGTSSGEATLRAGLDTVDGVLRAVAALYTVMARELPRDGTAEDPFDEAIRPAFAVVLDTMAESVHAFGMLLETEFEGDPAEVEEHFTRTLDNLRESRAILTELMLVDPAAGTEQWMLRGSVLSAVEQTLDQLDVLERVRQDREERLRRPGLVAVLGSADLRPRPFADTE
ncbi:FUSC family protein [Mobilicoccus pelagius]|uniref:FUSC family protein n=1 Tax=Mobilicoccus pelagius NBRC 104925 TaxID=1089455 RepID=H5UNG0_9MICO|nr:aromatic acid exporter family protein [Mobilicoccus pelagius]GAB47268.1 hypothetical protein MOPEL_007_00840 [Mobilicoccus pelagius NBRC 104925]